MPPTILDKQTKLELLKELQQIRPGGVFLQYTDFREFIMLAYTKENELLMSKPENRYTLPNYAICLGQSDIFIHNSHIRKFADSSTGLDLQFDNSRVSLTAIELEKVNGYDKDTLKQMVLNAHNRFNQQYIVYKANKDGKTYHYLLLHMKKFSEVCCAICIKDINTIDLKKHCVTNCQHVYCKKCIKQCVIVKLSQNSNAETIPCPLCMRQLRINATKQTIENCIQQRNKKFDKTWVTYVIDLERELPKKFPVEYTFYATKSIRKILADCRKMLKLWWFAPGVSHLSDDLAHTTNKNIALLTNKRIALLIVLYKNCVSYIEANYTFEDTDYDSDETDSDSDEADDKTNERLHKLALQLYNKTKYRSNEFNPKTSRSLEVMVDLKRIASFGIEGNLKAAIESNLIFSNSDLTIRNRSTLP